MSPGVRRCAGQATVEVVAGALVMFVAGLMGFQILAAGYAAVMADHACEQAALALAQGRSARDAAREAIPGWPAGRIDVKRTGRGKIAVTLRPPVVLAALEDRFTITSTASVRTP